MLVGAQLAGMGWDMASLGACSIRGMCMGFTGHAQSCTASAKKYVTCTKLPGSVKTQISERVWLFLRDCYSKVANTVHLSRHSREELDQIKWRVYSLYSLHVSS